MRPRVIVTGPPLHAVSGIATHVRQLLRSGLQEHFVLVHFPAGGEGLAEGAFERIWRRTLSPVSLLKEMLRAPVAAIHINTALNSRALSRDAVYLGLARLAGCPVLWQIHGGATPEEFGGGSRWIRRLLRLLLSLPRRVVVISRSDLRHYQSVVAGSRLACVRNGIDSSEYLTLDHDPTAAPCLRLTFMGRFIAEKGILDVIDAMKLLRDSDQPPIVLRLAGTGPLEQEVRQRIACEGLSEMVRLLGPVSGPTKTRLLGSTDLFLLPTFHAERLPYALLEAMAAGAPPITCAVGAIPEVVEHGLHGFIIEPRRPDLLAATVAHASRNRSELMRMSKACRARICESFSVQSMAAGFLGLYRECAGQRA